jgi:dipeptidyl aminopeptidase/acylaminoacyl peptidase
MTWDGDVLHTHLEDSGRVGVLTVDPQGECRIAVGGERVVTGFDVADGRLVFTATNPTAPASLYESTHGDEGFLAGDAPDVDLVEPQHFRVRAGDGEIDVWVLVPPDVESAPVLLNIHGGPASQYGFGFFDEFQVYAGAGFGVVACNPRGSSGRGDAYLQAVTGEGWGIVDTEDVTEALDAALEHFPHLDADSIGIMGGSYGGFLTAWMIALDDRFRSAVVERALLSWTSFSGTSDIAGRFAGYYLAAEYPDGWERSWDASPLAHAHRVTTPTLVLHSESDLRCPIEQAEQYFMALLRNGTPAELLRFPGEGHEMSRSGKPRHRVERFDAIIEWHRRWIQQERDR